MQRRTMIPRSNDMEYSFRSGRGSPLHFLTGSATLVGKVCSPAWTQARKFLPINTNSRHGTSNGSTLSRKRLGRLVNVSNICLSYNLTGIWRSWDRSTFGLERPRRSWRKRKLITQGCPFRSYSRVFRGRPRPWPCYSVSREQ